jgi:hypothetical protein
MIRLRNRNGLENVRIRIRLLWRAWSAAAQSVARSVLRKKKGAGNIPRQQNRLQHTLALHS